MQLFGSTIRRSFEKQLAQLHKTGAHAKLASGNGHTNAWQALCEELFARLEHAHATGDERGKGELLAEAYVRCEALHHLASVSEDAERVSATTRLLHDIPRYVERESAGVWKLLRMHAEELDSEAPETLSTREAFEEELREVRSGGLVSIETFLEKGRSVADYVERIYSHVLEAENPDDPSAVLRELAKAMLQSESLRRHASHKVQPELAELAQKVVRGILAFVDSDSAEVWERVRLAADQLRGAVRGGGDSVVPGVSVPN